MDNLGVSRKNVVYKLLRMIQDDTFPNELSASYFAPGKVHELESMKDQDISLCKKFLQGSITYGEFYDNFFARDLLLFCIPSPKWKEPVLVVEEEI